MCINKIKKENIINSAAVIRILSFNIDLCYQASLEIKFSISNNI